MVTFSLLDFISQSKPAASLDLRLKTKCFLEPTIGKRYLQHYPASWNFIFKPQIVLTMEIFIHTAKIAQRQ